MPKQNEAKPGDPLTPSESKAMESVRAYQAAHPDTTLEAAYKATKTTASVFHRARKKLGEFTSKPTKRAYRKKASPMQTLLVQDVTKKHNVMAVFGDVDSITQLMKGWNN